MDYYIFLIIFCLLLLTLFITVNIIFYALIFRRHITTYNSTDFELKATAPGSEIIYKPKITATRGYNVNANAELVWKFLAQMGSTRAGWYCFDRYLFDKNPSLYNIEPRYQSLFPNQLFHLKTDKSLGIPLISFKQNEYLLLGGCMDLKTKVGVDLDKVTKPVNYFALSWVFALVPISETQTRIITRFQADWADKLLNLRFYFLEPLQFFFEKGIIQGILKRIEHNEN